MKKIIIIHLSLLVCFAAAGQTITPQVINSAGGDRSGGGVKLTDNVGESFVQTIDASNELLVTQGFIQPEVISKHGFTLSSTFQGPRCIDRADDAFIGLGLSSTSSSWTATYIWSPSTVCPTNDCSRIDSIPPGIYNVTVAIRYFDGNVPVRYDTLRPAPFYIDNANEPCLVKVYSGVTPNGDGVNDVLQIDNIEQFPDNRVTIYNRWGDQLFDVKGYDEKDGSRSWPTESMKTKTVASTYFYIIELGKGYKPIKGWVELIKE
jgi:gliding motility-associated-like protein